MTRRFALARRDRLTQSADFRAAFASRCQIRDSLFILRANPGVDHHVARLGLAVPRRTVPKAWQRNRLKRLIRESFRHHKAALHGLDVVVLVTPRALAADSAVRRTTLERLWSEIAAKCKKS